MAKQNFLKKLFSAHLTDLRDIYSVFEDVFICPICFNKFIPEDISKRRLTDGHIWPDYIREKSRSKSAAQQTILLCAYCNHTAGSRGDKQMQLREEIKDKDKQDEIHGERHVQIIRSPGEEPINLRAAVNHTRSGDIIKGKISFAADRKTGQWVRNNPREQERFQSIAVRDENFSIIVHSHPELKRKLPEAGWITSAYLFAFYTFGYRYIAHESLTPVREYILTSFDKKEMINLNFQDQKS